MKKIIVAFLLILLALTGVVAAESLPPEQDTQQLLTAVKEMRYNVEAGTTYKNYVDQVRKSTIEYRKFIDKYPDNILQPFTARIIAAYNEAGYIWKEAIFNKSSTIDIKSPYGKYLINTYPSVLTNVRLRETKHVNGSVMDRWWWHEDVIRELFIIAKEQEAVFSEKVKEVYNKQ